jgi:hypothetical protein
MRKLDPHPADGVARHGPRSSRRLSGASPVAVYRDVEIQNLDAATGRSMRLCAAMDFVSDHHPPLTFFATMRFILLRPT